MKEEFLHFIWKNTLFEKAGLKTSTGKPLLVLEPGTYNRDSGPDFFNSRIRLGETEWAGNVEVHINASDWYRHNHHNDHSFDNVILHVVANNDIIVNTASGFKPDTYVMRWQKEVEDRYNQYLYNPHVIACSGEIGALPRFYLRHWVSRMAVERLERKMSRIEEILRSTNNDWDETLYRLLARYFGLKVNSDPFYLLSCRMPLKIMRKHADNRLQVESLLYGQAGMLEPGVFENEIYDEYYSALLKEYRVLSRKYRLKPIDHWMWKFHRLRPVNFPTIRISQFAGLISTGRSLFGMVKDSNTIEELTGIFMCEASDYWTNHFTFGSYKQGKVKRAGNTMIRLLLINTIIPLLFLYGKETGNIKYCERATDLLDGIKPENNRITREWAAAGIEASSALESQGLIHLRELYCKNRLCLDCQCGSKLISLGRNINSGDSYLLEEPGEIH